MDFFDDILTSTYLKSASLSLMLDNLQQLTSTSYRSGDEMMADALTGRIRSNETMLRQGAKNATEAANMATMVATSASSVLDNLNQMLTLAQEVQADPTQGSVNAAKFTTLATSLSAMITGTEYNGISLLDKNGWTDDDRLTVSGDGNSATLTIQLGYGSSTFTLRDLSSLSSYQSVDLSDASLDINALVSDLSTQVSTVDLVSNSYSSLASSYTDESSLMVEQADILKKAAQDAMPTEEDPLLRDIGSIISTIS